VALPAPTIISAQESVRLALQGGSFTMSMKLKLNDHLLARSQELRQHDQDDEALALLARLAQCHDLPAETAEMSHASLAEILVRRKKWTRARRHLAVALLYRPDCARYHHLMGLALASGRKTDPDRAREHFRKAIELDPEVPVCLADFGLFCLRQGDAEEGIETLQRAVALKPDDAGLLERLTESLDAVGRRDEARALLHQARFRHPRDQRFEQLWNDFRFMQTAAAQQKRPQQRKTATVKRETRELIILPFLKDSAKQPLLRRDGPSTLPPPHAPLRSARRSDMNHG
jgi:Flp pilus assembly protein TadD